MKCLFDSNFTIAIDCPKLIAIQHSGVGRRPDAVDEQSSDTFFVFHSSILEPGGEIRYDLLAFNWHLEAKVNIETKRKTYHVLTCVSVRFNSAARS